MQLKRFKARDNHSALKKVREALGPDAVIISNRKTEDGVEIIASAGLDQAEIEAQAGGAEKDLAGGFDRTLAQVSEALPPVSAAPAPARETAAKPVRNRAGRGQVAGKLRRMGLDEDLCQELMAGIDISADSDSTLQTVLERLKLAIPVTPDDVTENGGVVLLHGPTGAGKTTAIAKLATRFLRQHDARDLAIICADNARIGAHEQLQTFGKLLGVKVTRLRRPGELKNTLRFLGKKKLVLIDCAGLTQADLRDPGRLTGMDADVEELRHFLVLPATLQRATMDRVVSALREVVLGGVILTKTDDVMQLGGAISCLLRQAVPLAFVSDGQSIPNNFKRADAADLVALGGKLALANAGQGTPATAAPMPGYTPVSAHC
ncbi:hypothetical protein Q4485_06765 [Granulosicoccaceae sp. 1_MG-2023]|nr:hypothetical protein [Granulosicoccaceae sp. 1_MG-2023]